jgi:hypothetical protein
MLNLQDSVSIAMVVLLAITALILWRILTALRASAASRLQPQRKHEDKPEEASRASRGVLPLSSRAGHGRVPDVYVYDEKESTFRRVGLVNADGKIITEDPAGDGICLKKGKLYRIVGRPQRVAMRPERICIGKGTTPGGASDWNVHDIKIGNRSQLSQAGVIPGDVFSESAVDSFVGFETIQTAMDFSMDISYCGPLDAEPFMCTVIGTEAHY